MKFILHVNSSDKLKIAHTVYSEGNEGWEGHVHISIQTLWKEKDDCTIS